MHRPARQKENKDSSLKERESSADRAAENKRGVCQREEQREWDDEGKCRAAAGEAEKSAAAEAESGTMKEHSRSSRSRETWCSSREWDDEGKSRAAEAEKSAAAEGEKLDSGE